MPFEARLAVNRLLNARESDKEVRHYEIELAGSGISYRTGDSIAVHATNDPTLVDAVLAALGAGPDHAWSTAMTNRSAPSLPEHLEIRTPSHALQAPRGATRTRQGATRRWTDGKDVLDLIGLADMTVDEVVDTLRPLAVPGLLDRVESTGASRPRPPDGCHRAL